MTKQYPNYYLQYDYYFTLNLVVFHCLKYPLLSLLRVYANSRKNKL